MRLKQRREAVWDLKDSTKSQISTLLGELKNIGLSGEKDKRCVAFRPWYCQKPASFMFRDADGMFEVFTYVGEDVFF